MHDVLCMVIFVISDEYHRVKYQVVLSNHTINYLHIILLIRPNKSLPTAGQFNAMQRGRLNASFSCGHLSLCTELGIKMCFEWTTHSASACYRPTSLTKIDRLNNAMKRAPVTDALTISSHPHPAIEFNRPIYL